MISAYMTDTVTRKASGGLDANNEAQASTTTTHAAQVVWKTRIVRNQAGAEVTSAGHIVTQIAYGHNDRVVIGNVEHAVAAIEEIKVFSRVEGYRVYFT